MATILTEKIRNAVRISSQSVAITEEINDTIAAAKARLKEVGVKKLDETDELIVRAIKLFARAEFNFNNKGEQYRECFNMQAMSLSLDSDYNQAETVLETDTESEG